MAPKSSSTSKKKSSSTKDDGEVKEKPVKIPDLFIVRPQGETQAAVTHNKNIYKVGLHPKILEALGLNNNEFVSVYREGDRGVGGTVCAIPEAVEDPDLVDINVVTVSAGLKDAGALLFGDRVKVERYKTKMDMASLVSVRINTPNSPEQAVIDATTTDLKKLAMVSPGLSMEVKIESGEYVNVTVTDVGDTDLGSLSLEQSELKNHVSYWSPLFLLEDTQVVVSTRNCWELPKTTTYKSIGGLDQHIVELKSTIELPLHHPSLFSRFGISPPRGVLLHGPPGTGKTMLLRAVAQESNAHVLTINGPSIVSKYLGETESSLRAIFEEARKYQPAIVFIDEIDALVPRRDGDESGQAESRVVATLLTLMDGMSQSASAKIVVVGSTNRPNAIDPALRRAGRFDREVEIGIPNAEARLSILSIQMADMPHNMSEEDIQYISSITHGYVGADLSALCREGVMNAINRGLEEHGSALNAVNSGLEVTMPDLERALLDVRPSAMREIFLEKPSTTWSDIGGQSGVKEKLKQMVEWPLTKADTMKNLGITPPRGVLLYGPPGCSKTLIAKALANESGLNFLSVKGPELFNKYVGESERAVREIFRKARAAAPSIIFFDEIDALSTARGHSEAGAGGERVLTSLLTEMDGIESLNGVMVLAATNRPDVIDSALMRPGRLSRLLYVGPPDEHARQQILKIRTKNMCLGSEVDLEEIAKTTEGMTGAEIVALCEEAGLYAMSQDEDAKEVTKKDFDHVLKGARRGVTEEMLKYFVDWAEGNSPA
ncbi:P-loop containing nucleoside triphosphate hydrolase protein [Yarrowia lipolytica]|jgi:AAA family ATPase|uniref:YALI0E06655p n=3 Tax=Yarrowia lipolytica TaxID=4952 RepID=Q6C6S6_YARLI|nr:YALI0E06655p [Yarrowia lipolytica CLIB122]KAB8286138.1 P-loop containing nucleoside triphosphate hydrolase protein [Yarrowia lipolytica]KAE8171402.1 P-loop containing nucleoside triphosphate hydrolase protein [Yarrowia lipolytica]KAJ8056612.1 P-loop containing nucleoside triphosphate hydrolase protein [Yarrowia lipolytica]QNQ00311.1 ATPase family gene 2 protein [Yarrowia lipolytica]RDW27807.1 P-loop containing nucleoside triphosphate hydrolase protein [Yarrowia lipolytica]|eukprot:XP_503636.1 YALI0E06655p [Yarrowia lipolytica CLIB122]